MNDCDSANSVVLRSISGGMPVVRRGMGWSMKYSEELIRQDVRRVATFEGAMAKSDIDEEWITQPAPHQPMLVQREALSRAQAPGIGAGTLGSSGRQTA